jgi:outer membrane lipoprotein SlyB
MSPHREVQATPARPAPPPRPVVACHDCGRIERVDMVSNVRATSSGHAVLGGVVGGVAAGKTAAPAPSAKPGVQVLTFRIALRMDDGRRFVLHQPDLAPGLRAGSRVRVQNNRVLPPR